MTSPGIVFTDLKATTRQENLKNTLSPDIPDFVQSSVGTSFQFKQSNRVFFPMEDASEFSSFFIVEQNHMGSASHEVSSENFKFGSNSHKAYVFKANEVIEGQDTNHRAYPTFQSHKVGFPNGIGPYVLMDYWAYVDIDIFDIPNANWFSLATYTSYIDDIWFPSLLLNLDINYGLHLQHHKGNNIPFPSDGNARFVFPRKTWTRITQLLCYGDNYFFGGPYTIVWIDKDEKIRTDFHNRIDPISLEVDNNLIYTPNFGQAHWGMYCAPLLSSGVVYNDNISITQMELISK